MIKTQRVSDTLKRWILGLYLTSTLTNGLVVYWVLSCPCTAENRVQFPAGPPYKEALAESA
jgi:hypothetical protein